MGATHWPLARFVTALLTLVVSVAAGTSQSERLTTLQGTAVLSDAEYPSGEHIRSLFLKIAPKAVVKALFTDPEYLEGLRIYSGQLINVTGVLNATANPPGEPPTITVSYISPVETQKSVKPNVNVVQDESVQVNSQSSSPSLPVTWFDPLLTSFKMLVIPIRGRDSNGNICSGTQDGGYTSQDIADVMWGSGAQSGGYTLQAMYQQCSDGRTTLNATHSLVTDFAELPCGGTTEYGNWSIPGCGDNDQLGWQEQADAYVTSQFGVVLEDYDFITYIGPTVTQDCAWLAVGDYGCAANTNGYICRIWAHGNGWNDIAMYMHELGHHFFLMHPGQVIDGTLSEYGDGSCTMGLCCNLRCYNAPHAWQMGWLPLTEIDGSSLAAGSTISFQLGPQYISKGLRLSADWVDGSMPFFLSYRDLSGYEKDLADTPYGNHTDIYISPIIDPRGTTGVSTQWLGSVGNDSITYINETCGLTFRYIGSEGNGVRVSVCRYGGPEDLNSCCYGRDNDCNGQAGQNDAACASFMTQCSTFRYDFDLGTTDADPMRASQAVNYIDSTPSPNSTRRLS